MRLPWIQVDSDGIARGITLARLLKIPEAHGVGLCVLLWNWALEMAPEDDVSGLIADSEPAVLCAAAIGWDGDPHLLWSSFGRVFLVEKKNRVKGLNRYEQILKKRHRNKERRASSQPALRQLAGGLDVDVDVDVEDKKKSIVAKKPATPANPRLESLKKAMVLDYENIRFEPYKHGGAKDTLALKSLLPLAENDDIRRKWIRSLDEVGWLSCNSFAQLALKWNDLSAPQKQAFDPDQGIISR